MWYFFGLSATYGDRAGFVAEGDNKEKVSVLKSFQELINIGKEIGYSGDELQTFAKKQQDRQKRQFERKARREEAEREARKEQVEGEARREEAEREARKEEARREEAAAERDAQERKWQAELSLTLSQPGFFCAPKTKGGHFPPPPPQQKPCYPSPNRFR